jgi:hypothetical protein
MASILSCMARKKCIAVTTAAEYVFIMKSTLCECSYVLPKILLCIYLTSLHDKYLNCRCLFIGTTNETVMKYVPQCYI